MISESFTSDFALSFEFCILKVWVEAGMQVVVSLGPVFGGNITMSS